MTIMAKQPLLATKIMCLAVLCAGLLAADFTANACWGGTDKAAAYATITLDVKDEPLRLVLGKITKTTKWKIKAPDKWLEKPVTQTLDKVSLEEGLRSVLNNAGIENLLLTYDEDIKVVTIFDTESTQAPSAARAATQGPARANTQPPVVYIPAGSDPIIQRAADRAAGRAPARVNRRARRRSSDDEE